MVGKYIGITGCLYRMKSNRFIRSICGVSAVRRGLSIGCDEAPDTDIFLDP